MKTLCSLGAFFWSLTLCAQISYPVPDSAYTKTQIQDLLQKYTRKKDTIGLAFTYLAYAKNQENWNQFDESPVESYYKSLNYFRALGDSSKCYEVTGALGFYFVNNPVFYEHGMNCLRSAVRYFRENQLPKYEIGHLINLANNHVYRSQIDTASVMLKRAEALNQELNDRLYQGRIDAAFADLYRHAEQHILAVERAKKSLEAGRALKVDWLISLSLYYLGCSKKVLGQRAEALQDLLACQKITEDLYYTMMHLREAVYWELSNYYAEQNDYKKALAYSKLGADTKYVIYNSKAEIEVRSYREYQLLEAHQAELAKADLEKKLAEAQIESLQARQRLYFLSALLAFTLLGILAVAYFSRQRLNSLRQEQAERNLQIETMHALIQGQEIERQRVAQELHDGVGTLLSRLRILLGSPLLPMDKLSGMLDEACTEVRNISSNLQPNALEKFGLVAAVQSLVSKQGSECPCIIFQHFGEAFEFPQEKNLMIYRIIQELLANALKHAQASEIFIQLIYHPQQQLTLCVEDDGQGFEPSEIGTEQSGWRNIHSRVSYLNGTIQVQHDRGTSVTVEIPLGLVPSLVRIT